ncbi:MAG: hypothetical protein ACM3XM_17325 [Mycobacterium leprae]
MNKLVIIGGASAYSPDIISGLLHDWQSLPECELVLHDIDEPHLAIIARLAEGMVRTAGADWRVRATTDRADAVTGARFILTQPRVGGFPHRALDERIPLRYGLIGQETLGAGGLSFAWRSIPLMLEIVAEVQRLAPEAWIINYANPAGMVTEAVIRRFPNARFIGLCDMPTGVEWGIGKLLRVDFHRIKLDYAGINHGGWSDRVWLDGQDVMPKLRRWAGPLGAVATLFPLTEETGTVRLLREYGQVPDPYLRYYYYKEWMLKHLMKQPKTRAQVLMDRVPELYRHYAQVAAQERPVLTMHRGHQSHSDLASQVIRAIATGRRTRFVIQQRNGGAVPNLPAEEAAQFPAWVDGSGWERIAVPPIPESLAPLLQQVKAAESINVTAALEGNVQLAIEAAAGNPLVGKRQVADTVVRELIKAHKQYLPQFQ